MSSDWTPEEVAATVGAYLRMLAMDLAGQSHNRYGIPFPKDLEHWRL